MRKIIFACLLMTLVVSAASATAASLITSKQIKDGTIKNRDIAKNTISASRLSKSLQKQLSTATAQSGQTTTVVGPQGPRGENGAKGDQGQPGQTGTAGAPGRDATNRTTQTVRALSADGVFTQGDTRPGGTGVFATNPAGAGSLGAGSLRMTTPDGDGNAKVQGFTKAFSGRSLADIQELRYRSYRAATTSDAQTVALNMRVDFDGDGAAETFMVYEPYQDLGNTALKTGVWQRWDAYRNGKAKWWLNNDKFGCGQATPCTFDDIVVKAKATGFEPTIQEGPPSSNGTSTKQGGSLGFNIGSGNPGLDVYADGLTVRVDDFTTVYDFEPAS